MWAKSVKKKTDNTTLPEKCKSHWYRIEFKLIKPVAQYSLLTEVVYKRVFLAHDPERITNKPYFLLYKKVKTSTVEKINFQQKDYKNLRDGTSQVFWKNWNKITWNKPKNDIVYMTHTRDGIRIEEKNIYIIKMCKWLLVGKFENCVRRGTGEYCPRHNKKEKLSVA